MEIAGLDVPVEAVETTVAPGGAARPLNGMLASEVAPAAGLEPLRPWREALGDYMGQGGAGAVVKGPPPCERTELHRRTGVHRSGPSPRT